MFEKNGYRFINGKLEEAVIECDLKIEDLISISDKADLAEKNVISFLNNGPSLNMLLWGEKGSGKSTLLRILALKYATKGLITIEFIDENIGAIYTLYEAIRTHSNLKFIIYFDDISFSNDDNRYRRFKSIIEGGLESKPNNVMFVATTNRRHMVLNKSQSTDDIYDRDEASELTSLQARFGISIGFYPLNKEEYLKAVELYLNKYNIQKPNNWEKEAESYAIDRGGRTGRLAKQFASYIYLLSM